MSYTPPSGDSLTFNLIEGAYSAPTVNAVDFSFVESFTSTLASTTDPVISTFVATHTPPLVSKTPLQLESGRLREFGQRNVVSIQHGGTGADTASDALSALGGSPTSHTHNPSDIGAADSIHTHNSSDLTDITNNANTYLRRNTDNTAYEAKTSAEVLTDIGAAGVDHTHTPAILARQIYTATAGQIDFGIAHEVGYVEVFLNGVKLVSGSDFTDPDTTKISLVEGARLGDTVELVAFGTFQVADHYTKTESDTLLTGKLSDTSDVVTDVHIGNRTVDDTQVPSGDVGLLGVLLSWFSNVIKSITGKASWRTAPATTLEVANAHHNNTANPHAITKAQVGLGNVVDALQWHAGNDGTGSGLDADLLDGNEASAFLLNIEIAKTANTYLRRNSANGAYESKTPLQVADELMGVRDWRGRNVLINGNFDFWQRGTSVALPGISLYLADRWRSSAIPGGVATATRQSFTLGQTDVPGEPQFFIRHDRTTAATGEGTPIFHRMESVRTLAGQSATWSFWAKVASGTKNFTPRAIQVFGTGGSPSANVVTLASAITITTSWQKFSVTFAVPSISGKTLGTNTDDFLQLDLLETSPFSTFVLDFAQAQLEKGSQATEFEFRPPQTELALCQRYYQKSYDAGINPGTGGADTGRVLLKVLHDANATRVFPVDGELSVPMRAAPSLSFFSRDGTANNVNVYNNDAIKIVISSVGFTSQRTIGIFLTLASNALLDTVYETHFTADAEL